MSVRWASSFMVFASMAGGICWAQESKPKTPPAEKKESKTLDEKTDAGSEDEWTKLAQPGEHHKKFDVLVGTWNLEITFPDEGMPKCKGTSEFKWIMDGRFLVETTRTDLAGQPFEWVGWHAYDNAAGKYVSAWIDNFGTGIDTMTGQFDDARKTLTYVGETENPAAGGKVKARWVMRLENKDRFVTQMFEGSGNGHEQKVMEIVATRK